MKPLILPAMDWIISLLFFKKDNFGTKYPAKFDVPLNKETKLNQTVHMQNYINSWVYKKCNFLKKITSARFVFEISSYQKESFLS